MSSKSSSSLSSSSSSSSSAKSAKRTHSETDKEHNEEPSKKKYKSAKKARGANRPAKRGMLHGFSDFADQLADRKCVSDAERSAYAAIAEWFREDDSSLASRLPGKAERNALHLHIFPKPVATPPPAGSSAASLTQLLQDESAFMECWKRRAFLPEYLSKAKEYETTWRTSLLALCFVARTCKDVLSESDKLNLAFCAIRTFGARTVNAPEQHSKRVVERHFKMVVSQLGMPARGSPDWIADAVYPAFLCLRENEPRLTIDASAWIPGVSVRKRPLWPMTWLMIGDAHTPYVLNLESLVETLCVKWSYGFRRDELFLLRLISRKFGRLGLQYVIPGDHLSNYQLWDTSHDQARLAVQIEKQNEKGARLSIYEDWREIAQCLCLDTAHWPENELTNLLSFNRDNCITADLAAACDLRIFRCYEDSLALELNPWCLYVMRAGQKSYDDFFAALVDALTIKKHAEWTEFRLLPALHSIVADFVRSPWDAYRRTTANREEAEARMPELSLGSDWKFNADTTKLPKPDGAILGEFSPRYLDRYAFG